MRILICPDSFKGCLDADGVAKAIAAGVPRGLDAVVCPLADGGEGTAEILGRHYHAEEVEAEAIAPQGEIIQSKYWWDVNTKTAYIDVASASGLPQASCLNPLTASSAGTGMLAHNALKRGAERIVLGLGGSATIDGGLGLVSFFPEGAFGYVQWDLLCDVTTPAKDCVDIFGLQKGATQTMTPLLKQRLISIGMDMDMPRTGAAGGVPLGLLARFGKERVRMMDGAQEVMKLTGCRDIIRQGVDLIITGEGHADAQTLMGKVPGRVLKESQGTPVILLAGRVSGRQALMAAGFAEVVGIHPKGTKEPMDPDVTRMHLVNAASQTVTLA